MLEQNVRFKDRAEKRINTPNPREGRKAIEEDGAEVISLGCAGMARLDERLKRELDVPMGGGEFKDGSIVSRHKINNNIRIWNTKLAGLWWIGL